MSIREELLALAGRACEQYSIPVVERIFMPEPRPSPERDSEFGIVVLEDDSAGLYYAWLGDAQKGMNERYAPGEFIGQSPLKLVEFYKSDDEADRSLGMAAINAISQSVMRQAGISLPDAGSSMGELDVRAGDRVGMIGFFPSLVRRLQAMQVQVTVIERKQHLLREEEYLRMTMDPAALRRCNKVLSTASTLLNDSLDEILGFCTLAERIVVVGPTAGFLPDPLFSRGVSAIGGSQIVDTRLAIARMGQDQGMGDAARKYLLRKENYPGCGINGDG